MNRGFFKFPVLVIERLNVYVSLIQKENEEIRVICDVDDECGIGERTTVVVDAGSRDDGRQERRLSYIDESGYTWNARWKSELEWSMLLNRTVFH